MSCITLNGASTGLNISSNTFPASSDNPGIYIGGTSTAISGINIENNTFNSGISIQTPMHNNINFTDNAFNSNTGMGISIGADGISNCIIKNNNFSAGHLTDGNVSTNNTLIYSNAFGEIKWEDKTNLTINSSFYFHRI